MNSDYAKLCDLTENEKKVLKLVAKGYTNKEIGRITQTSPNSIAMYLGSIYSKIGANAKMGEGRDKRVCATLIYWGNLDREVSSAAVLSR